MKNNCITPIDLLQYSLFIPYPHYLWSLHFLRLDDEKLSYIIAKLVHKTIISYTIHRT